MTDRMSMLTAKERAALEEIKRRVTSIVPVRQFILFGSKARGQALLDSDIDLLILTGKKLSLAGREAITHEIFEVNLANDTNFSRVIVDSDEWEYGLKSVLPFHDNVMKDGVPV